MALTPKQLRDLNDAIAHILTRHLEPMFQRGTVLTFIARTPGNDEADVLVSAEKGLQPLLDLVARSMRRGSIGGLREPVTPGESVKQPWPGFGMVQIGNTIKLQAETEAAAELLMEMIEAACADGVPERVKGQPE